MPTSITSPGRNIGEAQATSAARSSDPLSGCCMEIGVPCKRTLHNQCAGSVFNEPAYDHPTKCSPSHQEFGAPQREPGTALSRPCTKAKVARAIVESASRFTPGSYYSLRMTG